LENKREYDPLTGHDRDARYWKEKTNV